MRYLGVDYGTKRVGLAVGEDSPFFVEPLRTVEPSGPEDAAKMVAEAAVEEDAEAVVVGMPYSLKGGDQGSTAEEIREFLEFLGGKTGLKIETEDERMTTVMVERMRRESRGSTKGFDRDAAAAAVILESYIERKRNSEEDRV